MTSIDLSHPLERALGDLRRGSAVLLQDSHQPLLLAMGETISSHTIHSICTACGSQPYFILPAKRLHYLFPDQSFPALSRLQFNTAIDSVRALEYLISDTLPQVTGMVQPIPPYVANVASASEGTLLQVARFAALLPVLLVWPVTAEFARSSATATLQAISLADVASYPESINATLEPVCEAPLTLASAPDCRIIAYRSPRGGHEHYALIVKDALSQDAPLVRIHSSCYTGDLLGSLRCDCQDQLQSALDHMGNNQGGIIIYLMQEGRGIGLVNKLRTYALQSQGLDTVDANEALGFDDDERLFLPAATLLKQLNVTTLKLLTNNPRKATGIEAYGIKVLSCVPHIMAAHEHNKDYLQTKKNRLGHRFE